MLPRVSNLVLLLLKDVQCWAIDYICNLVDVGFRRKGIIYNEFLLFLTWSEDYCFYFRNLYVHGIDISRYFQWLLTLDAAKPSTETEWWWTPSRWTPGSRLCWLCE